jgi:hypothetical protein
MLVVEVAPGPNLVRSPDLGPTTTIVRLAKYSQGSTTRCTTWLSLCSFARWLFDSTEDNFPASYSDGGRHFLSSSYATTPPTTKAAPRTMSPMMSAMFRGALPATGMSNEGCRGSLLTMCSVVLELPPHVLGP